MLALVKWLWANVGVDTWTRTYVTPDAGRAGWSWYFASYEVPLSRAEGLERRSCTEDVHNSDTYTVEEANLQKTELPLGVSIPKVQ